MDSPSVQTGPPSTARSVLGASLTTPQHLRPTDNPPNVSPPVSSSKFKIGDLVEVAARTWPGINKHGGIGRITRVHQEGTCYDVSYILGGSERKVDQKYIREGTLETGPRTLKERDFFFNYSQPKGGKTPASSAKKTRKREERLTRSSSSSRRVDQEEDEENRHASDSSKKRSRLLRRMNQQGSESESSEDEEDGDEEDSEQEDNSEQEDQEDENRRSGSRRLRSESLKKRDSAVEKPREHVGASGGDKENIDDPLDATRRKVQEEYQRKMNEAALLKERATSPDNGPNRSVTPHAANAQKCVPIESTVTPVSTVMKDQCSQEEAAPSSAPSESLSTASEAGNSPREAIPVADEPVAAKSQDMEVDLSQDHDEDVEQIPNPPLPVRVDRVALRSFSSSWKPMGIPSSQTSSKSSFDFIERQRAHRSALEGTFRAEVDRLYDAYLTELKRTVGIQPRCSALVAAWRRLDPSSAASNKAEDYAIMQKEEGKRVQDLIERFRKARDQVLARQLAIATSLRATQREEFRRYYSLVPSDSQVPLANVTFLYDLANFLQSV